MFGCGVALRRGQAAVDYGLCLELRCDACVGRASYIIGLLV